MITVGKATPTTRNLFCYRWLGIVTHRSLLTELIALTSCDDFVSEPWVENDDEATASQKSTKASSEICHHNIISIREPSFNLVFASERARSN